MNDHLNEWTTMGVECLVNGALWDGPYCMSGRCSVGVLLPGRSEGSHELLMWLLCNVSEIVPVTVSRRLHYYMATVVMVIP